MEGQVCFIDEAEFIKSETWRTGPLSFLAQNAVLIAVSTPGYTDNTILRISRLTDDIGKLICCTVDYSFICPDCIEAMREDPRVKCFCRGYMMLPHQDQSSMKTAEIAMGNEDRDAYMREIKGVSVNGECKLLDTEKVKLMFSDKRRFVYSQSDTTPEYVYVSCDPNGASKPTSNTDRNSNFAIVSFFFYNGKIVFCGLDAYTFAGDDGIFGINEALLNNYIAIRSNPFLKNATILYVPENNYAHMGSLMAGYLLNEPRIQKISILRDDPDLVGIHTDEKSKYGHRSLLRIYVANESIWMFSDLFTNNTARGFQKPDILDMFEKELNGLYEVVDLNEKTGQRKNRIISKAKKDDLEMAAGFGLGTMLAFQMRTLKGVNYDAIEQLPPITVDRKSVV